MDIQAQPKKASEMLCAAIGYFDGVHLGHAAVINSAVLSARRLGATPAVFTFDMSALRAENKGAGDILLEREKKEAVTALGVRRYISPDFKTIASMSGKQFVEEILYCKYGVVCLCCGGGFRFGKERHCGIGELKKICDEFAIELIVVPEVICGEISISSTRIKAALADGDIETAEVMLGRPYVQRLSVYEEKHLARKLGFPTINQRFPKELFAPKFGVYYTKAVVNGKRFDAVSNIGLRPTVDGSGTGISLETHILGFEGVLYGREITVEFVRFLRDEQKFASVGELKQTVEKDIVQVAMLAKVDAQLQ